ncbi:MAG: hypothetical protein C4308_09300 [Chitinophagaceae bacterium]
MCTCKKETNRVFDSTYQPDVTPSKLTSSTNLTNPYFLMPTGKKYIYEFQSADGLERVEKKRLPATKTIMGIVCIVVDVKEWLNGKIIEETHDWYAPDNDGNVWYFGEVVDNYNAFGNITNHAGSWEARCGWSTTRFNYARQCCCGKKIQGGILF